MSRVVNKTTFESIDSANTPDYSTDDWLVNPASFDALVSGSVPRKYWKVNATDDDLEEMTQTEKDVVDASEFPGNVVAKIEQASAEVRAYIIARYDEDTQSSLSFLYERAIATGKTNRAAHIAPAIDWVFESVLTYFYARKAAMAATTTQAELDAESWDYSTYDASDPVVTIESALAITD
jgi:hypothetical protein